MAELQILLTAQNSASAQLRAVGQDVQRLERQVEGVQRTTGASGGLLGGLSLGAGFAAVQAAVGGLQGLFDAVGASIFGMNSRLEQTTTTFRALTGSVGAAAATVAALRKEAATSPFSDAETLAAGRALITVADGSTESLIHLVQVAEQLAAVDPAQGLEGAASALREAVSGDFQSIAERFELSRQSIQRFRDQGMSNLQAVEAELQRLGVSSRLVEQLGQTFEGRRSTIVSFFDELRQRLGSGVFERIADAFGHMVNLIAEHGDRLRQLASTIGQALGAVLERAAAAATGPLRALTEAFAPGLWATIATELDRAVTPVQEIAAAAQQAAPAAQSLERQLAGIGVQAAEVQLEADRVRSTYDAQLAPLERQLRLLQQSADLQRVQNALASNRAAVEGLRLDREIAALQAAAGGRTDPNEAGLTLRQRLIALALQERNLRKEELGLTEQQRPAVQTLEQRIAAVQEQQRQALEPLQNQLKLYRDQADALQLQRDKAALLKQDLEAAAEAMRRAGTGPAAPEAVDDSRKRGEALADAWLTGFQAWIDANGGTFWTAIGKSLTTWTAETGLPTAKRIGGELATGMAEAFGETVGPAIVEALRKTFFPGGAPQAGGRFDPGASLPRVGFDPTGRMGQPATGPNVSVSVAVQPGSPLTEDQVRRLADEAAAALADSLAQAAAQTDPGPNRLVQGAGR